MPEQVPESVTVNLGDIDFPDEVYEKASQEDRSRLDSKPERANEEKPKETSPEKDEEISKDDVSKGGEPKVEKDSKEQPKETEGEPSAPKKEEVSNEFDEEKYKSTVDQFLSEYDTPEKRQELLKDIENKNKFTASNTKKAMKIADERKQLDEDIRRLESNKKSLEELKSKLDPEKIEPILQNIDDEVLEYMDDWYGESDNDIRHLIEHIKQSSEDVQEMTEAEKQLAEERSKLEFEKEILYIQSKDPKYKEIENLTDLCKSADELNTSITEVFEQRTEKEAKEALTNENITFKERIKSLEKELKELKSESKKPKPAKVPKGGGTDTVKKPVSQSEVMKKSWDEIEQEALDTFK